MCVGAEYRAADGYFRRLFAMKKNKAAVQSLIHSGARAEKNALIACRSANGPAPTAAMPRAPTEERNEPRSPTIHRQKVPTTHKQTGKKAAGQSASSTPAVISAEDVLSALQTEPARSAITNLVIQIIAEERLRESIELNTPGSFQRPGGF